MSARRPSNPLALAVLTLLCERPMHPYEMSTTLRERHKEDSIRLNYGSLYSVVAALHKRELVTVQDTVRAGNRPERTVYAITPAGQDVMNDWLSELISTPGREFTGFEAGLSLMAALPPDEAVRLLEIRLNSLRVRHAQSRAVLESGTAFPRIFTIEGEFQHALLGAEIEFVRALLADLRSGRFGGMAGWARLHELRAAGASPEEIDAKLAEEFGFGAWGEEDETGDG